mmetsp:Transcript_11204/g.25538  ORF Transcript_11204/g.25538 Transcript_11204/m.25538 type:complete len:712 (+) Transcript_11204:79-2214(+)
MLRNSFPVLLAALTSVLPLGLVSAASTWQTPLEKAQSMLQSLRDEVESEGDKEAVTYDHFACFCKDTIAGKSGAVTMGTSEKNSLQASLDQELVTRQTADTAIDAAAAEIQRLEAELKQMQAQRKTERLQYDAEQVDLTEAITALQSAIHTLEAAKTATGLMQLSHLPATVSKALAIADALAVPQSGAAYSALQKNEADPDNYVFSSSDVITTLHNLMTRFANKKTEIANTESQSRVTYEGLVQDNNDLIKQQRKVVSDQQAAKSISQERIQTLTSDLSAIASQLLDDQKYLAEVSGECSKKAEMWKQRSQVRVDELSALTAALEIINSEKVSGVSSLVQAAPTLIQIRVHKPLLAKRPLTKGSNHTERVALPSQKQQVNRVAVHVDGGVASQRMRAAELLRRKALGGKSLHGGLLMRLASDVEEDPFAKVKVLIQQLIERLLKEAESEANHKGWCDTNMGVAAQGRDNEASKIKDLNSKLEISEARRTKLTNLIISLDTEMLELQTALNESSTVRAQESAQNTAAIKEAEEARDAVASAIRILSEFYGVKPPATAMSLLLRSRNMTGSPEIPDAGFNTAYSGARGGAFGVLGMLEVLMGDFAKTAAQVQAEEVAAEQSFSEFSTATKASLAAKDVAFRERSASLTEADAEDSQNRANLVAAQAALGQLLDELDALYKACVDNSMTAEERKQHREEELEALQEALNILENY